MIPINFLAASKLQAAIECLPRTAAEDHNDRHSAGKGGIEMSKWQIFRHDYALGVRMPSDNKTTYGADRYITIGGFDRDNAAQMEEAERIVALIADAPILLAALESLLNSLPSLTCESFHHARKDQHSHDDECPPFERYLAEAIKARALIAKHRGGK
jgi:hypothetical protein